MDVVISGCEAWTAATSLAVILKRKATHRRQSSEGIRTAEPVSSAGPGKGVVGAMSGHKGGKKKPLKQPKKQAKKTDGG